MSRIVVVTGTDTGVGKTVATAALAVLARERGTVAMVKPVLTGTGGGPVDIDEVRRLAGCSVHEFSRLADPLAPESAARLRDVRIPTVAEHSTRIHDVANGVDAVIVEGAGGLLVRLDRDGGTLLDLATRLNAEVYVVCRAGLGTLNHAELTVAALRARGIEPAGLVIGSWPARPGLAATENRADLPRLTGVPLVAVMAEGAGSLSREQFRARTPEWFAGSGRQAADST